MYFLLIQIWQILVLVIYVLVVHNIKVYICMKGAAHIVDSYFSVAHLESVAHILFVHTRSFGAHKHTHRWCTAFWWLTAVTQTLCTQSWFTFVKYTFFVGAHTHMHMWCTFWWLTAVTQTDHFPRRSLTLPFLLLHNNSLSVSHPTTRLTPPLTFSSYQSILSQI